MWIMTLFEIIILLIWWLISILIPLALLIAGVIDYLKDRELRKTLPRFFVALAVCIFTVILSGVLIVRMLYAGVHDQPEHRFLEIFGKIFFVFILLAYSFSGWLLCSFVLGKLPFLRQVFNPNSKSPQSLFDSK
jgi:hypothetical protein